MNWRFKGLVQKALSSVPGGVGVNDLLQRSMGGLRSFDQHLATKVNDWEILVSHMAEIGRSPQGLRYVEVGSGWFPTLPICFSLAGAESCETYDLTRHMSGRLTFQMLRELENHLPCIAKAAGLDETAIERSYRHLCGASSLPDLLSRARIRYHAPADASATALPTGSVDIVFSNAVFEHVPPAGLAAILREARRILRPGGLTIHSLNCGDHYAYFDRSISFMNYLQYSDRDWNWWNSDLLYQNRLRPQDFLEIAAKADLRVVLSQFKPRPDLLALLPTLRLAPEFRGYSPEQLCSTSLDFVAERN
jgi:SAM-dependent methyltransferase